MFRSGTSLIWRILKADRRIDKAFYEPLHHLDPIERPYNIGRPYIENPNIYNKWSDKYNLEKIKMKKDDQYPELKRKSQVIEYQSL